MGIASLVVTTLLLLVAIILITISTYYNNILRKKVSSSTACTGDANISTDKTAHVTPITAGKVGLALNIVSIIFLFGVIVLVIFLRGK